ncbi:hypothetical protein FUT87_03450 [Mitsuaria sp. TWR114]|uniref:hypothetical protein n=1 Tax=Mitsuaria sp. TWR114 TaxID=2601731 RepID=UPI0011BD6622|nr:hypothetical protein [Mitsuaria sp. TWR114]TXD89767.1 hypothetical protein FUT87_11105 [Mitsuaria sp. TWR114]TXD99255.1 hypothetical protein FUT87_03450 [Mitsuaria sp. TWR114]
MAPTQPPLSLSLIDLASAITLPEIGRDIVIAVSDACLDRERFGHAGAEGLAIQRLITLAHAAASLRFIWASAVANQVIATPSVHPLAAVVLCLTNATHVFEGMDEAATSENLTSTRNKILSYRLVTDLFTDCQALVCVDAPRPSLPHDLYDAPTRRLRPEADFESLVDDLVLAQQSAGFSAQRLSKLRMALSVILRELLENTDDHAKTDAEGKALSPNSLRGLLVKRIFETRRHPEHGAGSSAPIPCLEFTIFDSGIGYYDSYRRQLLRGQARGAPVEVGDRQVDTIRAHALGPAVSPDVEYAIVLKCMGRHSDKAIPDPRPGHRGMGLYEVLRALKEMRGLLEVRTGRVHGFRSFLEGELRAQLEPQDSPTRPGMPRATLLDVDHRLSTRPAPRDMVRGTVVRVVVPLA